MVSRKQEKPSKTNSSLKTPKTHTEFKNKKNQPPSIKAEKKKKKNKKKSSSNSEVTVTPASASQYRSFFLNAFQSANALQLSSIELESIKETSFLESSQELGQEVEDLGKHVKAAFGPSWKQVLCERQLVDGKIEPGSPAVLIISTSALRSIELLRGVRSLTRECHAVKLFSKHVKVEEQVTLLKERVNIASGTPSRVKKLIDIEALGLSRLAMIVLDIHTDVKGYSLLTLPQVRDEFWGLYKNYFHQRLLRGDLHICLLGPLPNGNVCLLGPLPNGNVSRGKRKKVPDE